MTRIGFAYNQKPEPEAADAAAELSRADEEPPSSAGGSHTAVAALLAPAPDDEFAEWDSAETIDAVARALARYGEVIRLEATRRLSRAAARRAPRHRLQHRRRTARPEPRGARPGDLRVLRHPLLRQRSRSRWRSASTRRARRRSFAPTTSRPRTGCSSAPPRTLDAARRAATASFPLFAKPVHEGSSKGITERNFVGGRRRARARSSRDLLERYEQPVLVETFLPGDEFTCGVLGNGAAARVLPIVGMNFGVAARGRAADLRLRGEVALGSPGESARHLLVPGSDLRRAPRRDRARRAPRVRRARLPRLVARRRAPRCDGTREHRRGESAAGNPSRSGGQLVPAEGRARGGTRLRRAHRRGARGRGGATGRRSSGGAA